MPWRAASLTAAAPSSGCGTSCGWWTPPRSVTGWRNPWKTPAAWWWFRPSPAGCALLGYVCPWGHSGHHPRYGRAHIARAVLECIAYQVTDLMLAMRQDAGCDITALRADGGASVSDILMQMQADLLRIPVDRPTMVETTAFGAASLAGLACGLWRDTEELAALRRSQRVFLPQRPQADCDDEYRLWKKAVSRACHWAE